MTELLIKLTVQSPIRNWSYGNSAVKSIGTFGQQKTCNESTVAPSPNGNPATIYEVKSIPQVPVNISALNVVHSKIEKKKITEDLFGRIADMK